MRIISRKPRYLSFLLLGIFSPSTVWAENESWPETLTLEYALKQASADHPQLQMAAAEVDKARAEQLLVESTTGIDSKISAQLRWVDPPDIAYDQSQNDSRLSLFVNKRLYDFGYTKALEEAANAGVINQEHYYQNALNQHRIAIMAAYFDVILADLANSRDEEDMATTYIASDRARDRNELGMVSDIDLMEKRSIFQASRTRFHKSSALQRTTRARLADVLNRPEKLPSELSTPELIGNKREVPKDVDEWLTLSEKQNPLLLALQARMLSAQKDLESARQITNPVLKGEVEVSAYTREAGSYDNWRAGVTLDVPLKTSGKAKAIIAKNRAEFLRTKAELEQQRRRVRQAVLESWSNLKTLLIERDKVAADMDISASASDK